LETPATLEHREWLGREVVESVVVHNGRSNAVTAEDDHLLKLRVIDRLCGQKGTEGERPEEY
jgi:hypothetical protein